MGRKYNLDLMRVFLSLCVITLHSLGYFAIENGYVSTIVTVFLIQADGLFYMLSGYFNLEKEFNSSTDIKKFYKTKIINVLFPFLAFLFVWAIWDYLHVYSSFDILDFLGKFYESVMNSSSDGHLWFMYPLFGMLLSTPFLSKMLHHMDEKELKMLWLIALGWNAVCYYMCYDFGISFRFLAWFLDGWPIYYFAGYYYRHVIVNESTTKWTIIGLIGFVGTLLGIFFAERFVGASDIQPLFTLSCIGCLLFWDKFIKIKNGLVIKVVTFLSTNTFLIYLYHMRGIEYVTRKLALEPGDFVTGLIVVFGTFIFSLVAAFITNLCLKPVKKLLDKIWIIK